MPTTVLFRGTVFHVEHLPRRLLSNVKAPSRWSFRHHRQVSTHDVLVCPNTPTLPETIALPPNPTTPGSTTSESPSTIGGKTSTPRRLGRGLSGLIPTLPTATAATNSTPPAPAVEIQTPVEAQPTTGDLLRAIPTASIVPNPDQPRTRFDQDAMDRLTASIRADGVLQPIVVREHGAHFQIIAGERRWRAAKAAGLSTVPAIVRTVDDRRAAEWAMVENLQREDLNPMERAAGLHRLISDFSMTHQEAADRVGMDRATVSNLLRLLALDASTAALVAAGSLSQGHAKVLLAVPSETLRETLAKESITRDWSVRRLEAEIRDRLAPASALTAPPAASGPIPANNAAARDLERRLSDCLGTAVRVQLGRRKGQGRIQIDFHSLDQLDGILERLGLPGE